MHNKLLINAGFYLLLIFSFTVALYPPAAYAAAAGLLFLWLLDLLIFREPEFVNMPLYYPLLGLIAILLVAGVVARIYGAKSDFAYLAFLSLFYFVVSGFVVTNEQRSMVLWTFASGVLLYAGIKLVVWWGAISQPGAETIQIVQPHISFLALAISVLVAFLAEARGLHERLFYALVCLPPIILALMTADKTIILALLAIIMAIAIFREPRLLVPIAVVTLLVILGLGGIHYYLERNFDIRGLRDFISMPIYGAMYDPGVVSNASFFGADIISPDYNVHPGMETPFFLGLIEGSGPPAFLMMVYIFLERARESFFKRRKVTLPEEKSYHLTVLLVVACLVVLNLYDTTFFYPNAVLASWMILGIYEA